MKIGNGHIELQAGALIVRLGRDGRILRLRNRENGMEYRHAARSGYLVRALLEGDSEPSVPCALRRRQFSPSSCHLTFGFGKGREIEVEAEERTTHLRLRIVGVNPPDDIACLCWGPVATSMEGPIGEYLGVVRDDGFAIGMLGLGMNTDGRGDGHNLSARWYPQADGGSSLELETWDWSRDRPHVFFGTRVAGKAVPQAGLPGAGIALYGCPDAEVLKTVETVEVGEGLPHPVIDGQWVKRSRCAGVSSWWTDYTEENIDRCLDLAVASGLKWLCRFRTFGNWGHFEPDPGLYPGGFAGFKACSDKAEARGIHALFYTLSTFTKEISVPEPYISPAPDPRLQTVLPETRLVAAIDTAGVSLQLAVGEGVLDMLNQKHMEVKDKVIRIDDELIRYEQAEMGKGFIVLTGCERGYYRTVAAAHGAGGRVVRMLFTYWKDFFPGTEEMNAEIGRRIGDLARKGNFRQVTLDGHEGCHFTGHGAYSQNVFLDAIYRETNEAGFIYTGSCLGNWSWHALSYISWGEYDCHKGFRGGMLDYRLWRMIQLRRNLMPRRIGQHYPDKHTTVEDIEWLMALAAGWDAGVELHVTIDDFNQNPDRDRIVEKIRLWEEARLANVFTGEQKRSFRQTDRLHSLSRGTGGWEVRSPGRWQYKPLLMTPSASVPIRAVHDGSVAPCGVAFDWTHDPGIYQSAWLSDDMVHGGGRKPAVWEFEPPPCDRGERVSWDTQKLQVLIRLPETATSPIRNLRVKVNDDPAIQVRIPVELRPGQYLSTPHDMPMVFVYDGNHEVVKEIPIRDLPALPKGRLKVELSFEGKAGKGTGPILNLGTHRHIPLKS